jgi:hypothetical protein
MDGDIVYSMRLLLNEIFNRNHYNIPQLDGEKCHHCHKPIIVCKKTIIGKNHKCIQIIDRSVRVDCDEADGEKTKNVAFHRTCWQIILSQAQL